jgi:hypothetical protein
MKQGDQGRDRREPAPVQKRQEFAQRRKHRLPLETQSRRAASGLRWGPGRARYP